MPMLRTVVCGMTLLCSALMLLPQPVAAQSAGCLPAFLAPVVPAPNCATTASFALINGDRSLQIVLVGLKCDGKFVTGAVNIKALQVRVPEGEIFQAGATSTTLVGGTGTVIAPAGGGELLANCGTSDPSGGFGTMCQNLIIAVEDLAGIVKGATGVH